MTTPTWQLIVPVKPSGLAKSRLGADATLARAMAHDTVSAASAGDLVDRIIVVTADLAQAAELIGIPKVDVVLEDEPSGINAAIAIGLADLDPARPRGVLLGDLPSLRAADLDDALAAADRVSRSFVRDANGTGTSLVTARSGIELIAHFGPESAAQHLAAGLADLPVRNDSTLRRDVDTASDLEAARSSGLGLATRAALG
jgi:2-phospho-L-lactate guanylyltransferase